MFMNSETYLMKLYKK